MTAAAVVFGAVAVNFALATPASAAPPPAGRPVALIMVPELTWATAPSSIEGFAKASLSMRSAPASSGTADTYVTLGKGGRSAALASNAGVGRVEPAPDGSLQLLEWPALQDRDDRLHYGGTLGSVGEALRANGRRWALVSDDKDAAAVATTAAGSVPQAYPASSEGIRSAAQAQLDAVFVAVPAAELAQTLDTLASTCTLVVSASTPARSRHLGLFAASPPCGLGQGGVSSSSTHHAHLVTLPDVSATFLDLAGIARPSSIAGDAVTPAAEAGRDTLVARDRRAWTADRARTPFVWLFVVLHAVGAISVVRRPNTRTGVCCALLAIPAASFLMMLVPWWRGGAGAGLLVGGSVAGLIALGGAALVRRDVVMGTGVLAAVIAGVVAVDALFASPLQVDAPFGNSPVGAGRFFGVGNIGSGFLVAGLLVAGGLAIERWGRRCVPWVGAALAAGTVAGGAPQFGADAGGVLFAVPAYGVLLLGSWRARVTARQVVVLGVVAVVAVALFAAVDLTREAGSHTHLARGVADQGLREALMRKAGRAVHTVTTPIALLVPIAAAVLGLTRYSPGASPALRFTSWAVVVAAVLGSLLNDSGVMVAAAVLAVAWPAGVVVSSRYRRAPAPAEGVPA